MLLNFQRLSGLNFLFMWFTKRLETLMNRTYKIYLLTEHCTRGLLDQTEKPYLGRKGRGVPALHRGSTAFKVLGVICHPQNEPLISVIQGPCGF